MTPEQFCYWLQGALETRPLGPLDQITVEVIADHLKLVFDKKTPAYDWLKEVQKRNTPIGTLPYGLPTVTC